MEKQKVHIVPKYVIYGFFILGLLSALAFRAIILFQRLEASWVRPVWYIGQLDISSFSSTVIRSLRRGKGC